MAALQPGARAHTHRKRDVGRDPRSPPQRSPWPEARERLLTNLRSRLGARFWGRRLAEGGLRTWMQEEVVRHHINRRVTGSEGLWPIEWYGRYLGPRRFGNALSLGCGDGALERDLLSKRICASITALDLSERALDRARSLAADAGLSGITYARADLNSLVLPPAAFDAAFFHQSLHHVEDLDACLRAVASALRPEGLMYLDEYIGPSRHQWSRQLLKEAEELFARLPRAVRRSRRLRLPVDWRDPTEAVNSSGIVAAVSRHFTILERRDYGGNYLSVIYPHLRLERLTPAERDEILLELIRAEERDLAAGGASFHAVLVAAPAPTAP